MKSGELTIGSRLPTERALAETLGIGRNSTREALSIMHGMGLIERRQGSGNYISENVGQSISRGTDCRYRKQPVDYTDGSCC